NQRHTGGLLLDLAGEGTGGVVEVEILAVKAEQEDQDSQDGNQRRVAELRSAPAADDEEDNPGEEDCCCGGDSQPLGGGHKRLVLHVLRGEDENEDQKTAEGCVEPEQPSRQDGADAVEEVGGGDGGGRNGGRDVAGKLRSGEGEE